MQLCEYLAIGMLKILTKLNYHTTIISQSQFSSRHELFSLKPLLVKPGERLTAACSLGFPLHCLTTDHSVFVIDQRFPGSSVCLCL